jgi:CubicO group peptidase (beta-lactamase class C family)
MERLRTFPQLAPLGSFVSYNNTGFILLGRLIEVATGLTYRAAVEALVLGPLGMTESTFAPEEIDRQPHAVGHGPQGTTIVTPLNFPRNIDQPADFGPRPGTSCATLVFISATALFLVAHAC